MESIGKLVHHCGSLMREQPTVAAPELTHEQVAPLEQLADLVDIDTFEPGSHTQQAASRATETRPEKQEPRAQQVPTSKPTRTTAQKPGGMAKTRAPLTSQPSNKPVSVRQKKSLPDSGPQVRV